MGNSVTGVLQHAKTLAGIAIYALGTFAIAGLLVGILPSAYDPAVLVGWIASLFIASRLYKSR